MTLTLYYFAIYHSIRRKTGDVKLAAFALPSSKSQNGVFPMLACEGPSPTRVLPPVAF